MNHSKWRIEQCRKVDLSKDSNCQNLFTPIQQFCEERARKSRETSNTNGY